MILQEDPLVVAPIKIKGAQEAVICVGCCCDLDGQGVCCPNCSWPMCGKPECWQEGSHHALGECLTMQRNNDTITFNDLARDQSFYLMHVLIKRCYALAERQPEKWKKLRAFTFSGKFLWPKELETSVKPTVVKVANQLVPNNASNREWMIGICLFFFTSSYELPALEGIRNEGLLVSYLLNSFIHPFTKIHFIFQALYSTASMMSHSCVPNATRTFTKDGQIIIRAAVPIAKGAKITLNFTKSSFTGTMNRQIELQEKTKFELCRCERCKDPTELGTFASTIYCVECPNQEARGILLWEDPLAFNYADWVCNKCPHRVSHSFVHNFMKMLEEKWLAVDRKSFADCERFLRQYSDILHPQHYFFMELKLAICNIYAKFHEEIDVFMTGKIVQS